jgi:hypothetical protein
MESGTVQNWEFPSSFMKVFIGLRTKMVEVLYFEIFAIAYNTLQ